MPTKDSAMEDSWLLRYRLYTGGSWQAEAGPYAVAADETPCDREPGAIYLPGQVEPLRQK